MRPPQPEIIKLSQKDSKKSGKKRKRTKYPLSTQACQMLQCKFSRDPNPNLQEMSAVAAETGLSEGRIVRWFKKRRRVEKQKKKWHKKNPDSPVIDEFTSPRYEEIQWPEEEAGDQLSKKAKVKQGSSTRQLDMAELEHRLKELKEGSQHPERQDVDEEEHVEIEQPYESDFELVEAEAQV